MSAVIEDLKASILNLRTTRDRNVQDGLPVLEIDKKIAELEAQITVEEQQVREQLNKETIESTVDALAQMFEALWPESTYKTLIGITEFEEKRQNFYQLTNLLITEKLDASNAAQEQILAQRDEKIQSLTSQAAEFKAQYEEEKRIRETTQEAFNKLSDDYTALETKAAADKAAYESNIANLNAKLDAAQKTKEETKPSQSFTDKINAIKSRNELTPDDMLARWNARQKSEDVKIDVPSTQQENPFRGEDSTDTSADAANNQVLATTDVNQGEQFPSITSPAIAVVETGISTEDVPGQSVNGELPQETGTVTRSEFEALKAEVEALKVKVA